MKYIMLLGATATGKTAIAFELAKKLDAIIVNCDSMQIYDALPIVTAQPDEKSKREIEHHLFSYISPDRAYSVGQWLKDVVPLLAYEKNIIFVGGTGLYFKALLGEISFIPDIDSSIRSYWREQLLHKDSEQLYRILQTTDAQAAAYLNSRDGQRIIRALEVWHGTGKSITYWQKHKAKPLLPLQLTQKYILDIPRELIYDNINKRVERMVENGAIEEVKRFLLKKIELNLPIMRAIGVSEFSAYLQGEISLLDSIELVKIHTRQYAKRQLTWQRHQLDETWHIYEDNLKAKFKYIT